MTAALAPVPEVMGDIEARCASGRGTREDAAAMYALVKQLRAALEPFADAAKLFSWPVYGHDKEEALGSGILVGDLRRARTAHESKASAPLPGGA